VAKSLNVVHLIGRTGREPSMRYTGAGKPCTTFSLATDRRKADGQTEPDWHAIVCWDKLAEFANQNLSKGRLLYVSGRLSYRVWTGQDGQPRHTTEVVAGEILLLDRPPAADAADGGQPADAATADGDDLPF
jgi:single-strand DNA-binding protein